MPCDDYLTLGVRVQSSDNSLIIFIGDLSSSQKRACEYFLHKTSEFEEEGAEHRNNAT
jgi:hypothetical protein